MLISEEAQARQSPSPKRDVDMHIGKHKLVLKDFLALLAPLIISGTFTCLVYVRNDNVLPSFLTFLVLFGSVITIWILRMRKYPEDPWRFDISRM